jgi:hypothetical protein
LSDKSTNCIDFVLKRKKESVEPAARPFPRNKKVVTYMVLTANKDRESGDRRMKAVKHSAKTKPVTFDTVREIAQTLPGTEESTSYGTPAFKVKGKLFARQHQDGESLVVGVDFDERKEMMSADPEKFYITDHYLNYPWMLVRMSKVRPDQLRDLLIGSWRRAAPENLLSAFHRLDGK